MARQRARSHRPRSPRHPWWALWLGGVLAALTVPGFAARQVDGDDEHAIEVAIEAEDFASLLETWERVRDAPDEDSRAAATRLRDYAQKLYDALGGTPELDHLLFIAEVYRGSHNAAHCNLAAARILLTKQRMVEALQYLRDAAEVIGDLGYDVSDYGAPFRVRLSLGRVRAYRRLGWVDRVMQDVKDLERERDRLRSMGDRSTLLSNIALVLANLDVMNEDWSTLAERLESELESKIFLSRDVPEATYFLAQAIHESDPQSLEGIARARALYRDVLDNEFSAPDHRARTHLRLARMAMELGEFDEAMREIATSESVAPGDLQSAEDHAHRCVFAVRLARMMNSGIEEASRNLMNAWEGTLDEWRRAPLLPEGVGFLAFGNQARILTEVVQTTLEESGPRDALRRLYEFDEIGTLSRELAAKGKPTSFHRLEEGELFLRYFVTGERTHVFCMAGDSVECETLQLSQAQLDAQIDAANRLVRQSPRSKDVPSGRSAGLPVQMRRLHDLLLPGGVRAQLPNHAKLSICGVDRLGHLSFECLVGEDGVPLGLTHEIAYAPSSTLQAQLTSEKSSEPALAVYSGGTEMGLAAGWADGLLASYPRSALSSNFGAVPDSIGAERIAVVQFLGHGRFDSERNVPAVVILDDGVVGVDEVLEATVTARLAVLTACEAWRGPLRPGDGGVGHLGSAFLQRGSQAIVLPDAEVEVGATLAWSQVFHTALTSGVSPARAALEARRALASTDDYEDPFYHSLLHVVGDGHTPLFEGRLEQFVEPGVLAADSGGVPWRELLAVGGLLLILGVLRSSIKHRRAG